MHRRRREWKHGKIANNRGTAGREAKWRLFLQILGPQ